MRLRLVLARAALVVCSFLAIVLLMEVALRRFPALWPHGSYAAGRFSSDLRLRVHGTASIYNRVRWNRRIPNRDGFLDVNHLPHKPPGVVRVGFFGDSYVEAEQVPLEDTFFRRLPAELSGYPIEAFAFGISGWGTLHSLLAYRVMGPRYDLDYVVYLFVENDPGDHYYKVQRRPEPTAELSDDGIGFIVRNPDPQSPVQRAEDFLGEHLMLARLIRVRFELLRMKGDEWRNDSAPGQSKIPDQNDYPSAWPPTLLAEAQLLTRRILAEFRDEVVRDGRRFVVLYVPSGDRELDGTLPTSDSWFPWLSQTCAELGIQLLDPRRLLSERHAAGTRIYDDHWTPAGHALIASFVAKHLADDLVPTDRSIVH